MNNEEKILEMLAQIQAEQKEMRSDIAELKTTQGQMQTTLTRVAVTQENVVLQQLKLLAEGHETLLNTLARKDRVEALEDDVALLKTVIKAMSQRIAELEKAKPETA